MSADAAATRSLASADLLVSLLVPADWQPVDAAADLLEVAAPAPADDGYRTTLTVRGGAAAEPGAAWFTQFADSVAEQLIADDPLLTLVDLDRFQLSSLAARVVLLHLRRDADPEGLPPLEIVQAWVWAGSHRMLVVGGSTPSERAAVEVPQLIDVVRSIRLLPGR